MSISRIAMALITLGVSAVQPLETRAHPVDCAILLCLAGGFPPSAECTAAKATMIRRITPWPVSPPLQLWRCPLGLPAGFTPAPGSPEIRLGPDGLTDEVRQYRDGIEIYHIRISSTWSGDTPHWIDRTVQGQYRADGSHHWLGASFIHGPAWLAEASGARRVPIRECVHESSDGYCWQWQFTRYENHPFLWGLHGVAMRYEDHEGNKHIEFVPY